MERKDKDFTGNIIIPFKPEKYDIEKAISLFPYVEWRQYARPEVGGAIYLYVGKSAGEALGQQLAYEFEVLATDVESTIDDSCCMKYPWAYSNEGKCLRMKFIRRIPHGLITLDDMKAHGLSKYPQSQMRVPCELQAFIDSVLK